MLLDGDRIGDGERRARAARAEADKARASLELLPATTYLEFPTVKKDSETVWVGQHVQLVFDGGFTLPLLLLLPLFLPLLLVA